MDQIEITDFSPSKSKKLSVKIIDSKEILILSNVDMIEDETIIIKNIKYQCKAIGNNMRIDKDGSVHYELYTILISETNKYWLRRYCLSPKMITN